jgi:predicted nuclease of predicted toxin-antitoxin system
MANRLRFHLDEHVPAAVAEGLRRRGVDVTTTAESGLLSADDREQLEHARREGRVLVTHDADFLRLHRLDLPHAGIVYGHSGDYSAGQVIRFLLFLAEILSPEEMVGRVEFL